MHGNSIRLHFFRRHLSYSVVFLFIKYIFGIRMVDNIWFSASLCLISWHERIVMCAKVVPCVNGIFPIPVPPHDLSLKVSAHSSNADIFECIDSHICFHLVNWCVVSDAQFISVHPHIGLWFLRKTEIFRNGAADGMGAVEQPMMSSTDKPDNLWYPFKQKIIIIYVISIRKHKALSLSIRW